MSGAARKAVALAGLALVAAGAVGAAAFLRDGGDGTRAPLAAAGVEERPGALLPLDLAFTREDGSAVRLGEAFRDGRPVVLTLAYYGCDMLCPMVLRDARELARGSALRPGTDYRLLTVSIDPRDGPADAARARRALLAPDAAGGWEFWTGGAAEVSALAERVGFRYGYDPRGDRFAHAALLTVLTPGGRVSGYLYGVGVPPERFEAALAAAAGGEAGSSFERVLMRCFHYVPALRAHASLLAGFFRGGGALVLLAAAATLFFLGRRVRPGRVP